MKRGFDILKFGIFGTKSCEKAGCPGLRSWTFQVVHRQKWDVGLSWELFSPAIEKGRLHGLSSHTWFYRLDFLLHDFYCLHAMSNLIGLSSCYDTTVGDLCFYWLKSYDLTCWLDRVLFAVTVMCVSYFIVIMHKSIATTAPPGPGEMCRVFTFPMSPQCGGNVVVLFSRQK